MSRVTPNSAVPHPAKGVLAIRRITIRRVASVLGMSEQVVGRMLNGVERPTRRFRSGIAAMLDIGEDLLFSDANEARQASNRKYFASLPRRTERPRRGGV